MDRVIEKAVCRHGKRPLSFLHDPGADLRERAPCCITKSFPGRMPALLDEKDDPFMRRVSLIIGVLALGLAIAGYVFFNGERRIRCGIAPFLSNEGRSCPS